MPWLIFIIKIKINLPAAIISKVLPLVIDCHPPPAPPSLVVVVPVFTLFNCFFFPITKKFLTRGQGF